MESELTSLIELALERGISYPELISSVHEAVITSYRERYPDKPRDVHVVVDETEGDVRLFSGKKDVTPAEFTHVAARIARGTILRHIKTDRKVPLPPSKKTETLQKVRLHFPHSLLWVWNVLFWGYNSIFAFYLFVFVVGLISGVISGGVSPAGSSFGFYRLLLLTILLVTPVASMVYVVKRKLHADPSELARFFFTVEVPIAILTYVPVIVYPDPIPSVVMVVLLLVLIPITLYKPPVPSFTGKWRLYLSTALHEIVFLVASYTAVLMSFFLPLIVVSFFTGFIGDVFQSLFYFPFSGLGDLILGILVVSLWAVMLVVVALLLFAPYLLSVLFAKSFWQRLQTLEQTVGRGRAIGGVLTTALVLLTAFILGSYKPTSTRALEELQLISTVSTFEAKEQHVQNVLPYEKDLRETIKNIANVSNRYPFRADDIYLAKAYESVLNFDPTLSQYMQDTFLLVASPFVYKGPTEQKSNLYQLFEYVFGTPVYEQPRYQPFTQENVTLVSRTVRTTTDYEDLVATVSVADEYTNKTFQNQEVIYEFSLPTEAVVTDLRLGPSLEFTGVIAPRGAARRTYEAELTQRRDPALLEQTGPRKYRLRVFPIPGKNDTTTLQGKNQKVQFSYVVGLTPDGYPLPEYSKVTNLVTTNTKTTYWLHDEIISLGKKAISVDSADLSETKQKLCDGFSPLPSRSSTATVSAALVSNRNTFGQHSSCSGRDLSQAEIALQNKKIAVLLDVSSIQKNFAIAPGLDDIQLLQSGKLPLNNAIDVYKFNDRLSEKQTLVNGDKKAFNPIYFGKSDVVKVLRLVPDTYDGIFVLTAQEKFDVTNQASLPKGTAPVYMIHASGTSPSYSRTFTNYLLQSGGGTAESLFEALDHYVLSQNKEKLTGTSYWSIESTVGKDTDVARVVFANVSDPLGALAARGYLFNTIDDNDGNIDEQLGVLDMLHLFARGNHILTPYSSMLSLVNQAQLLRLEEESKRYDRFEEGPTPVTLPSQPIFGTIEPPMLREESLNMPLFDSLAQPKLMAPSDLMAPAPGAAFYGGGGGALTGFGGSLPLLFILLNAGILGGGIVLFAIKAFRRKLRTR